MSGPQRQPSVAELELARLRSGLMQRHLVHFSELIDWLGDTCLAAEQGDHGARTMLGQFLDQLDRVRAARFGIVRSPSE